VNLKAYTPKNHFLQGCRQVTIQGSYKPLYDAARIVEAETKKKHHITMHSPPLLVFPLPQQPEQQQQGRKRTLDESGSSSSSAGVSE
jgi:hypothetical protein